MEVSLSLFFLWEKEKREQHPSFENPSNPERRDRTRVFLRPIYGTTQAWQNKTYETRSERNTDAWTPGVNAAFEMIIHSVERTQKRKKKNDTIAFITNAANAEKLCPSLSVNHVCDLVPQAHDSPLRFGYNSSLILWKASVNASKTGHYTLSLWDPAL